MTEPINHHVMITKTVFDQCKEIIDSYYDERDFHLKTVESIIKTDIHNYINFSNKFIENDGIALEFSYGIPSYLWTKYGQIRLIKGDCWYTGGQEKLQTIAKQLINNFECFEIIPKTINFNGQYGPVYQIKKVNDFEIENVIIKIVDNFEKENKNRNDIIANFRACFI